MSKDKFITIRVATTTYAKILKIKKSTGATIKWIVDRAIKQYKERQ